MANKKGTSEMNIKHDKVVLKKIGPHVEIYGPYTKRELRRLLLSSISLYPNADSEQEALKQIGVSRKELKSIRDGQQISEKTQETLRDLDITKDMIKEVVKKGSNVDNDEVTKDERRRRAKDNKDFYEKGKRVKVHDKENQMSVANKKENFMKFFKERQISEDLTNRILKNGFTEEIIRLLESLGFSSEELKILRMLLSEIEESESLKSEISEPSSSNEYMSIDSLYLKSHVSTPIKRALREIILKKPNDPVGYLGQWLLHFKVCEEREKRHKECEMELLIEREKLKLEKKSTFEFDNFIQTEEREEEELQKNWYSLEDFEIH